MSVLVLGGTATARALADALAERGIGVVSSLAGRTDEPLRPVGRVRTGGFGGVDGLVAWLVEQRPAAVLDATHPFAAAITRNAVAACARTSTPYLRLGRSSWRTHPDASHWHWVGDHEAAAHTAAGLGGPVLLTVGRQPLPAYADLPGPVVARVAQDQGAHPPGWTLLVQRGPFSVAAETDLLNQHGIATLVSKDAGGTETAAKLAAARACDVAVVMVARPELPGPEVTDVDEAVLWAARACRMSG